MCGTFFWNLQPLSMELIPVISGTTGGEVSNDKTYSPPLASPRLLEINFGEI